MADTKLTREWVEKELQWHARYPNDETNLGYAALCRHYLATEQDTLDAARYEFLRVLTPREFTELWHKAMTSTATFDATVDAALTQKESPK